MKEVRTYLVELPQRQPIAPPPQMPHWGEGSIPVIAREVAKELLAQRPNHYLFFWDSRRVNHLNLAYHIGHCEVVKIVPLPLNESGEILWRQKVYPTLTAVADAFFPRPPFSDPILRLDEECSPPFAMLSQCGSPFGSWLAKQPLDADSPLFRLVLLLGRAREAETIYQRGAISIEEVSEGALHRAARSGNATLVSWLLKLGSNPCALVRDVTPLWQAARGGSVEVVTALLNGGAHHSLRTGRKCPLSLIIARWQQDDVRTVLQHVRQIIVRNGRLTPLHCAALNPDPSVYRMIQRGRLNPHVSIEGRPLSPLGAALLGWNRPLLELFLKERVPILPIDLRHIPWTKCEGERQLAEQMIDRFLSQFDHLEQIAEPIIAELHLNYIRWLIESGRVARGVRDPLNRTLAMIAIEKGRIELVSLLLEPNWRESDPDLYGRDPADYAARSPHAAQLLPLVAPRSGWAKIILRQQEPFDPWPPLFSLLCAQQYEVVQEVVRRTSAPAIGKALIKSLVHAPWMCNKEALNLLHRLHWVVRGADFHAIAAVGNGELLQSAIQSGKRLTHSDWHAVLCAANHRRSRGVMEILYLHHCLECKVSEEKTLADCAALRNDSATLAYLLKRGATPAMALLTEPSLQASLSTLILLSSERISDLAFGDLVERGDISDLEERLFVLLLDSDLYHVRQAVAELCERRGGHEEIWAAYDRVRSQCALISRVAPSFKRSMVKNYGSQGVEYETQQERYSKSRLSLLQKIESPPEELEELHRLLHGMREGKFNRSRNTPRGRMQPLATPLARVDLPPTRYTHILPLVQELVGRIYNRPSAFPKAKFHPESGRLTILGVAANGVELPCTRLRIAKEGVVLCHSSGDLTPLMEEASDLYRTLIKRPQEQSFTERVGRLYWLACQICFDARGSAQKALEIHHYLHTVHGLPLPVPSRYAPFPDLFAQILPYDRFAKLYPDLFEDGKRPAFDPLTDFSYLD